MNRNPAFTRVLLNTLARVIWWFCRGTLITSALKRLSGENARKAEQLTRNFQAPK